MENEQWNMDNTGRVFIGRTEIIYIWNIHGILAESRKMRAHNTYVIHKSNTQRNSNTTDLN